MAPPLRLQGKEWFIARMGLTWQRIRPQPRGLASVTTIQQALRFLPARGEIPARLHCRTVSCSDGGHPSTARGALHFGVGHGDAVGRGVTFHFFEANTSQPPKEIQNESVELL